MKSRANSNNLIEPLDKKKGGQRMTRETNAVGIKQTKQQQKTDIYFPLYTV